MKYYIAVTELVDWPTKFKLCSTREKARDVLYAEIGGYIADCIKQGEIGDAIDFINLLKYESNDSEGLRDYFYIKRDGGYDEYYIEEVELDN